MGQPNTPYAPTGLPSGPAPFDGGVSQDASPWTRGSALPGEIPGWRPAPAAAPQASPYDVRPRAASPAPQRTAGQQRPTARAPRAARHAAPVPGVIEGYEGQAGNTAIPAQRTPQRGPLRIVSDDPNEIRRYAEAQRLSKTGAFVAIPRPVPGDAPEASPQPTVPAAPEPPRIVEDVPAPAPSVAVPDPSVSLADPEQTAKPSARAGLASRLGRLKDAAVAAAGEERTWRLAIMWVTSIACVLATITMLYFPAQELYLAVRENERLTDELARNNERNEQMLERVSALQTAEGIQDEARRVYGLTLPYDNPVTVVGLDVEEPAAAAPAEVPRGSGRNTSSWATDLLDNVFGAVGSSATVAEVEDRATVVEG